MVPRDKDRKIGQGTPKRRIPGGVSIRCLHTDQSRYPGTQAGDAGGIERTLRVTRVIKDQSDRIRQFTSTGSFSSTVPSRATSVS